MINGIHRDKQMGGRAHDLRKSCSRTGKLSVSWNRTRSRRRPGDGCSVGAKPPTVASPIAPAPRPAGAAARRGGCRGLYRAVRRMFVPNRAAALRSVRWTQLSCSISQPLTAAALGRVPAAVAGPGPPPCSCGAGTLLPTLCRNEAP